MMKYTHLDVFLVVNSERERVLKGNFSIRKNPGGTVVCKSGVDLNRNYPVDWELGVNYNIFRKKTQTTKLTKAPSH